MKASASGHCGHLKSGGAGERKSVFVIRMFLLRIVDLSPLQFSTIIHINGFPFGENIQPCFSGLTMAVAASFHAAERKMNLRSDRGTIYIDDAGFDLTHRPERGVDVLRVNRTGETVGGVV